MQNNKMFLEKKEGEENMRTRQKEKIRWVIKRRA